MALFKYALISELSYLSIPENKNVSPALVTIPKSKFLFYKVSLIRWNSALNISSYDIYTTDLGTKIILFTNKNNSPYLAPIEHFIDYVFLVLLKSLGTMMSIYVTDLINLENTSKYNPSIYLLKSELIFYKVSSL